MKYKENFIMSKITFCIFNLIVLTLLLQNYASSHYNNACLTPLSDVGHCVSLQFCPEVPLFFTKLPHKQAIEYSRLLRKICGNRVTINQYPLVCCTKPNYTPMQRFNHDTTPFFLDDSTPEPDLQPTSTQNSKVLNNDDSSKACQTLENESGYCKPLKNCTNLLNTLLKNQDNEFFKTYLRASHEVCDSTTTEVCCPGTPVFKPVPTTPKIELRQNKTNNFSIRPPNEDQGCGNNQHTIITKVVGGHDSHIGAWPWLALLGYDPYSAIVFRCGGTLITARHVVTAAHCILPELSFVRLGEFDLSTESETTHIDINIEKVLPHENYKKENNGMLYDLAMLYLEKNVDFTALIYPICLPMSAQLRTKSFVEYTPFAAGWGRTSESGQSADILQEVQLTVHENNVCRDAFAKVLSKSRQLPSNHFGESVLCAGDTGKDTCKGDSGGPLMAAEQFKGVFRYYLIGVVSYGIGCAKKGVPAIYTSTQYFMDWILQKIEES